MKKSNLVVIIILFGASAIFLIWRKSPTGSAEVNIVKKELSTGISNRKVIKGKEQVQVISKKFQKRIEIKRERNENVYTLKDSTKDYNLNMIIKPKQDSGKIRIDYRLEVNAKTLMRIDTVSLFRVDTLKIEKVKTIEYKRPFYDSFWFGSAVTSLVILLFGLLIK
jgi:outer membrane receptor for monomeric catechols